jgi:hypothetical protein
MDRAAIDPAIKCTLIEIARLTADAARIGKAAEACALAGSISEGTRVSMEIEQIAYKPGRLHDAASLLNRLSAD